MLDEQLLRESDDLAAALDGIFALPKFDESGRHEVSHRASRLSFEHGQATRVLFAAGLVPSGLVVLRAQYEALVRSVWALYGATDAQIGKLSADLDIEAEQSAKNLPLVQEMMNTLATKAPVLAYQALANFKSSSWTTLNSYVHAGVHPIQRHETGHPVQLVQQVLKNSNGLALIAAMQGAVLTGNQQAVRHVGGFQEEYRACLPAR
jgi:hypothetical protein